jgi:hypothetical protein
MFELCIAGDTSSKFEPATPSPLRDMEGGLPMDDFTPATRKGKAKESKIVDLPNIKEAASAEMRAAAEAHSSEDLQMLWDGWCSKVGPWRAFQESKFRHAQPLLNWVCKLKHCVFNPNQFLNVYDCRTRR